MYKRNPIFDGIFVHDIGIYFSFSLFMCFKNDFLNLVDDSLLVVFLFLMLIYVCDSVFL